MRAVKSLKCKLQNSNEKGINTEIILQLSPPHLQLGRADSCSPDEAKRSSAHIPIDAARDDTEIASASEHSQTMNFPLAQTHTRARAHHNSYTLKKRNIKLCTSMYKHVCTETHTTAASTNMLSRA